MINNQLLLKTGQYIYCTRCGILLADWRDSYGKAVCDPCVREQSVRTE